MLRGIALIVTFSLCSNICLLVPLPRRSVRGVLNNNLRNSTATEILTDASLQALGDSDHDASKLDANYTPDSLSLLNSDTKNILPVHQRTGGPATATEKLVKMEAKQKLISIEVVEIETTKASKATAPRIQIREIRRFNVDKGSPSITLLSDGTDSLKILHDMTHQSASVTTEHNVPGVIRTQNAFDRPITTALLARPRETITEQAISQLQASMTRTRTHQRSDIREEKESFRAERANNVPMNETLLPCNSTGKDCTATLSDKNGAISQKEILTHGSSKANYVPALSSFRRSPGEDLANLHLYPGVSLFTSPLQRAITIGGPRYIDVSRRINTKIFGDNSENYVGSRSHLSEKNKLHVNGSHDEFTSFREETTLSAIETTKFVGTVTPPFEFLNESTLEVNITSNQVTSQTATTEAATMPFEWDTEAQTYTTVSSDGAMLESITDDSSSIVSPDMNTPNSVRFSSNNELTIYKPQIHRTNSTLQENVTMNSTNVQLFKTANFEDVSQRGDVYPTAMQVPKPDDITEVRASTAASAPSEAIFYVETGFSTEPSASVATSASTKVAHLRHNNKVMPLKKHSKSMHHSTVDIETTGHTFEPRPIINQPVEEVSTQIEPYNLNLETSLMENSNEARTTNGYETTTVNNDFKSLIQLNGSRLSTSNHEETIEIAQDARSTDTVTSEHSSTAQSSLDESTTSEATLSNRIGKINSDSVSKLPFRESTDHAMTNPFSKISNVSETGSANQIFSATNVMQRNSSSMEASFVVNHAPSFDMFNDSSLETGTSSPDGNASVDTNGEGSVPNTIILQGMSMIVPQTEKHEHSIPLIEIGPLPTVSKSINGTRTDSLTETVDKISTETPHINSNETYIGSKRNRTSIQPTEMSSRRYELQGTKLDMTESTPLSKLTKARTLPQVGVPVLSSGEHHFASELNISKQSNERKKLRGNQMMATAHEAPLSPEKLLKKTSYFDASWNSSVVMTVAPDDVKVLMPDTPTIVMQVPPFGKAVAHFTLRKIPGHINVPSIYDILDPDGSSITANTAGRTTPGRAIVTLPLLPLRALPPTHRSYYRYNSVQTNPRNINSHQFQSTRFFPPSYERVSSQSYTPFQRNILFINAAH